MFVGLSCHVCRSLLSYLLVSFVIFIGHLCHVCRSLWSDLLGLSSLVWRSLLSCLLVSFVIYAGFFCQICTCLCVIYVGHICRSRLSCICTYMTKETYIHDKRDQQMWPKRPINMTKETYKTWQKGPINMTKETNNYDKRDQQTWQERPTNDKRDLHIWPTNQQICWWVMSHR